MFCDNKVIVCFAPECHDTRKLFGAPKCERKAENTKKFLSFFCSTFQSAPAPARAAEMNMSLKRLKTKLMNTFASFSSATSISHPLMRFQNIFAFNFAAAPSAARPSWRTSARQHSHQHLKYLSSVLELCTCSRVRVAATQTVMLVMMCSAERISCRSLPNNHKSISPECGNLFVNLITQLCCIRLGKDACNLLVN